MKIGGIEVVLARNAHQREQRVAPGIGERRAHALRRGHVGDGADRPVRPNPLPRRMRQQGGQIDQAAGRVDGRGLHDCDLVLAERLAHNVEAARERGIRTAVWIGDTRDRRPHCGRSIRRAGLGDAACGLAPRWL